ncbi:MAG TPA: helix-turn-helix domain-containing protein, partial [Acidimicrobiia bacterium]|nr:helix-turn-helix domain-containing protein [Acidimicrobiia bacterium]
MQSVERAFAILRALAMAPGGVTELSDRVDLPKSTVARMLATLLEQGAVEQPEAGGAYRLGVSIADLAGGASVIANLVAVAKPHL